MATLASLVVNVEANTAQYTSKMRGASSGMQSFRSLALRTGAALGTVFGGRALLRGLGSIRRAFQVQEDAVVTLRASLIATGKDGAESLDRLTASAAALQQQTKAGDESIIKATASLAQLAPALDVEGLEQAQSAIIGIAETFTKGDLENAALLIGKSIGSTTNALTRYGIQVDTTATAQEKLAQIVAQSSTFFDVAQAKAGSTIGVLAQLGNAFGDLKEAIGKVIDEKTGFKEFITTIKNVVTDLAVIASGSAPQIREAFGLLGVIAGNAFSRALLAPIQIMATKALDKLRELPRIVTSTFLPQMIFLSEGFALFGEAADANIEGAIIRLGEIADEVRAQAGPVAAAAGVVAGGVVDTTTRELSKVEQAGHNAGESLIRGFIQGATSLGDLLVGVLKSIATDLIIGTFNKSLGIESPSKMAARAGRNTILGYIKGLKDAATAVPSAVSGAFSLASGVQAGAGGGTIVNQENHFHLHSPDQRGMRQLLLEQGGTIAQIVFDAAQDGAGFRRGLRGR